MKLTTIKERSRNRLTFTSNPIEYGIWVWYYVFICMVGGIYLEHNGMMALSLIMPVLPFFVWFRDYIRDFLVSFWLVRKIFGGKWVFIEYCIYYSGSAEYIYLYVWERVKNGSIIHTIDNNHANVMFKELPNNYKIRRSKFYITFRFAIVTLVVLWSLMCLLMYN